MFSGLIEEMGAISILNKSLAGTRLTIIALTIMDDLAIGASVSVNGTCLTVVARTTQDFSVDVSPETLQVTTLGSLASGSPVNLERAMKLNERLGGHMVSGHVDGIGVLRSRHQDGNALILEIEAPKDILRLCVTKGSITVDGISLTINSVTDKSFFVSIIPHTAKVTTLGLKQAGDQLNLESDLIGKYVERLLQERGSLPPKPAPVIDKDYLKKRGLI
jgi:riboflavin synthase